MGALKKDLAAIYPVCCSLLGPSLRGWAEEALGEGGRAEDLPDVLSRLRDMHGVPGHFSDVARLELALFHAKEAEVPQEADSLRLNPSVQLVQLHWKNLPELLAPAHGKAVSSPTPAEELVVVWKDPVTLKMHSRAASAEDLLALKMVAEGFSAADVAAEGNAPLSLLSAAVDAAVRDGILLAPASKIRRETQEYQAGDIHDSDFLSASIFTLQWHITQACDLHCKHCYDRSDRATLSFEDALKVLDDLSRFCEVKHVRAQVSFSGGNPLLYPRFMELYYEAAKRGFALAILGNPAPREHVEALVGIEKPVFFQVSLEGLEEHNDRIRGQGHFKRTLAFLGTLRDLGIYSMVMLTLTKDNMGQILPLCETLRGLTDLFTFNRLAMVGEGANLSLPSRREYALFLERYVAASETNPVMGLKDNLMNIIFHKRGEELFGGCTGFGCGAAFNFISVLSDGEVHACRKLPSRVGNIFQNTLLEIYDSEAAERFRQRPEACSGCPVRRVCGGCLAVTHGHGVDIFSECDPYCFINK